MTDGTSGGERRTSLHGFWSSRFTFILAVTGAAVGLGNIWKFPYIAGQNGGGAFVLVYLLCVFGIGLPIMMSEILIGRRGRRNPIATMQLLGEEESGSRAWGLVGVMGVMGGFLILSYYSVIAGWTMAYVVKALSGAFAGASPEALSDQLDGLRGSVLQSGFWHTLFMGITVSLVALGVERGLERAVTFMVPALVVIMLILLGYSVTSGQFGAGLEFMFQPDFSRLTGDSILAAMGQAFFTLSVGMGSVMAYGAYLPQETSITRTSIAVVSADTAIAILAGMVIFPIILSNGLDPTQAGMGLIFKTLPLAFGTMTGGVVFGPLFFLLLGFAALTSAISLMEPAVAWVVERWHISRASAAITVGSVVYILGFATVLSFNVLSGFTFWQGTLFADIDYLTANIMLPLGGLFITVFAGWVMCRNSTADELDEHAGPTYRIWRFLAQYIAPAAVVVVFLNSIGVFD